MTFNSQNTLGINFAATDDAATFATGTTALGANGRMYVYAKAGASITADNAVVNITESGGVYTAAATGGLWNAGATTVPSGDYAWFFKDITGT